MNKTILLVDDSATMLMSLSKTLTISGLTVETASDGSSAAARTFSSRALRAQSCGP